MVDIGYRSGMLEVVDLARSSKRGKSWLCKCDCGNTIVMQESHITKRQNRNPNISCGCHQFKQNGKAVGKTSRMYNIWRFMVKRCHDPRWKTYEKYGKKGITVCEEWRNDFETFMNWSIENGYKDDLTIDRIDSKSGYSPENCRWADYLTQAHNRGMNKNNKTGFTGINRHNFGYRVAIKRNYRMYYIGLFKSLDDAVVARDMALEKINQQRMAVG